MLREVGRGERRTVRALARGPLLELSIGAGRDRRSPPARDDRHGDHRFGEGGRQLAGELDGAAIVLVRAVPHDVGHTSASGWIGSAISSSEV